ncbi:hypothetical protein ACH5RR_025767 [Cinchona calisaya]|uniref:RNase H type-1 domain-containing protein n=1 Tax=Cinchona calisaya TaxID=153742 RepID=A0ABD2Z0L7_9GENT
MLQQNRVQVDNVLVSRQYNATFRVQELLMTLIGEDKELVVLKHSSRVPLGVGVKWTPPSHKFIKGYQELGNFIAEMAEALATWEAISLIISLWYTKFILEVDAALVVKLLTDETNDFSPTGHILDETRKLLKDCTNFEI